MDLGRTLGLGPSAGTYDEASRQQMLQYINLQLLAMGLPPAAEEKQITEVAQGLIQRYSEAARLMTDYRCPADRRIEEFLNRHFADLKLDRPLKLPSRTLVLDRWGMARELSLPVDGHVYQNELLSSYRLHNGVLHNPKSDRRTTEGTFHVTEGGLPVPSDKKAVPKHVFAKMFQAAMNPPPEILELPFTANRPQKAQTFVSLLLRPVVCPEVPGVTPQKTMEVRFFAPGTLVSNLDFVESIFSNAGDPFLPENDAGLDVEHWTGHTGCVILAPHLTKLTKKELGLPHIDQATERQKRDGMCWSREDELYNDGVAFKLTCRSVDGVIVTLISDNYYGYCKKEVKTQISYAANLYGNVEEEHAGGALAFPSYSLGDDFDATRVFTGRTFADVARDFGELMEIQPEGYGIDRIHPDLIYVPENAVFSLGNQSITWSSGGGTRSILLDPRKVYMTPGGYKVRMEKHPGAPSWRLIGTRAEGTVCHKPCTVSGGGKSEISKSIVDYMHYGPIFVADLEKDFEWVEQVFKRDYTNRWREDSPIRPTYKPGEKARPVLSPERSLGSVIKLLTPSSDYSDEYNQWLASIPDHIWPLVFIIKRFYKPEWGDNWREHFGVDIVNGFPGHELKYNNRKTVGVYLRVGLYPSLGWRTFKVRQDYAASAKVQIEDDITASVVVPTRLLSGLDEASRAAESVKFVINCENRLFQRPDDAIHRGLDKQTELDLSRRDNFISNFEPLDQDHLKALIERAAEFDQFTPPMQKMLREAHENGAVYTVASSEPRLVNGKPSKNPRYLQVRPDLVNPFPKYVAERGIRLARAVAPRQPVHTPVHAVLMGRRNNPPDVKAGIRPLAVYNPIHYQELPELFMDFISSLTGKSPSTTGAGSEGALTKGPFNAVRPAADLNAALVSFILTGLAGFSTAAGYVGPKVRVDHDISLLIPEIWSRLEPHERDPRFLIEQGFMEPVKDFEYEGEMIPASRLGYRITRQFLRAFFGRVFDNPGLVFDEAILKPETQDLPAFVDGIRNILDAHKRVATGYIEDGSIESACPPLRALLMIMATGSYEGKDVHHPDIRRMFTRQYLLSSDWYRKRLETRRDREAALWQRHLAYLDGVLADPRYADVAQRLDLPGRRALAQRELQRTQQADYVDHLVGFIGAHPFEG